MNSTGIDIFDDDDIYVSSIPKSFDLLDDTGDQLLDNASLVITDDTTP